MKRCAKKVILLVACGTSVPEAKKALDNIDRLARLRFPQTEIRWAYTSSFIRRKLARHGEVVDSPKIALTRLLEDGFTHAAVQSLHVAAGLEFHKLAKTVAQFRNQANSFALITLGKPLLNEKQDVERVIAAVMSSLPRRDNDDAVILIGHGHERDDAKLDFADVEAMLQLCNPIIYLGMLKGAPSRENVLGKIKNIKPRRVFLVPLMLMAGHHAYNDLAGDTADSWKSQLEKLGAECIPLLQGLGENDEIATVWLDHLATILTEEVRGKTTHPKE